jgi:hypothetical protein
MATGRQAFSGPTALGVLDAVLSEEPVSLARVNPDVPQELERIVRKALEKDRRLRYQHASEIRADLERLQRDSASGRSFPPLAVAADGSPEAGAAALDRRTPASAQASASRARRVLVPVAVALAVLGLSAAGAFYLRRAPGLTDKDSIVLADFTNTTGDAIFDGTLRQGLSAQLQQSPYLSIVSDNRIGYALQMMERPRDTRLTVDIAREVCQRASAAAFIEGSIAALGSQYVIGLQAVNCRTGDVLTQQQTTANGKEMVLAALGEAASDLRARLGESRGSIEAYDVPLTEATTRSLDALQAYTLGRQAL